MVMHIEGFILKKSQQYSAVWNATSLHGFLVEFHLGNNTNEKVQSVCCNIGICFWGWGILYKVRMKMLFLFQT